MSPKESSINSHKEYTGFLAHYDDGRVIKERENYHSKKLKRKCATNWLEINKDKLTALELVWHGQSKAKIEKECPKESDRGTLKPSQWFFSHYGYMDLSKRQIVVVARNIGYVKDGVVNMISVNELTGVVTYKTRAR